jgi:hypothetical protein
MTPATSRETDSLLSKSENNCNAVGEVSTYQHQASVHRNAVQDIRDALKDALKDHLDEANEGDDFFLTMT